MLLTLDSAVLWLVTSGSGNPDATPAKHAGYETYAPHILAADATVHEDAHVPVPLTGASVRFSRRDVLALGAPNNHS